MLSYLMEISESLESICRTINVNDLMSVVAGGQKSNATAEPPRSPQMRRFLFWKNGGDRMWTERVKGKKHTMSVDSKAAGSRAAAAGRQEVT